MKPRLLFLLLAATLHAQNAFLLPQEHNLLVNTLTKKLRHATHAITVITDRLHASWLKKELKTAAKKGVNITLITQGEDDTEALALYQNITIRRLHAIDSPYYRGRLSLTLFYIDADTPCFGTTPLDERVLKQDVSWFTCKAKNLPPTLGYNLLLQSTPYLKL